MSFHGGLAGVLLASAMFIRSRKIPLASLWDLISCSAPIGLFFGRIANFINGELFGRVTDVPWAMVFPGGGPLPRHPSQIYEAILEGILLFFMVNLSIKNQGRGRTSGLFLMGYGFARIMVEFVREPDAHLGELWGWITMGQILSIPLVLLGLVIFSRSYKENYP
jgi:phosphatidylglycerol:prolipoprotein diacylglycerol transferase